MIETLLDSHIYPLLHALWQDIASTFTDPKKRVFIGYLFCAALIAAGWLKFSDRNKHKNKIASILFSRDVWWSYSARADYQLILFNKVFFTLLSPALLTQIAVATLLFETFVQWDVPRIGLFNQLPNWALSAGFTLFLFTLDDFSRFYLHRLMHKVPALWAFHEVHHSARTMTPLTVLRTHPVEGVLFAFRSSLVQGISIALFVYLFGDRIDLITILGASFVTFVFNVTGSNLRHSHIAIHYWPWLEKVLISPAQHQIHHSVEPRHFDKNFGAILAVWDNLFSSLHLSEPSHTYQFGVSSDIREKEQSISQLLVTPFMKALRIGRKKQSHPTNSDQLIR